MIVPVAIDWDRDGDLDLVVGDEDGRVALVEHTGTLADRLPRFLAAPSTSGRRPTTLKFGALATPAAVDWDGDGDTDLVCGNSAGYIGFFENLSGRGSNAPSGPRPGCWRPDGKPIRIMAGPNGSIQGPCEAKWGYTTLSVADWDGDGLPDLVVNSIWGKVVWYRNVGTRKAPKLAAAPAGRGRVGRARSRSLAWSWRRPEGKGLADRSGGPPRWPSTGTGDGLPDLVMLDHEGYLALFERARRDGKLVLLPPRRCLRATKPGPAAAAERRDAPARAAGASSASSTGTATASSTSW